MKANRKTVLQALSTGASVAQASDLANVSRNTVYRWLQEEDFSRELKTLQDETLKRLSVRLIGLSEKALEVLGDGMESRNLTDRVRCASTLLNRLPAVAELADVERRIEILERRLG